MSLSAVGCGGGETGRRAPKPAATPEQFAERFAPLTGVHLEVVSGDPFGTRLEQPREPDRFVRFGTYSLTWTQDDASRQTKLGREARPYADGVYWSRAGDDWAAAKPFGPRLVLEWAGGSTRTTTPRWARLERAVRAAYLGKPELLPEAERPCEDVGLDPLRGREGSCSVEGIPVTFVDARASLSSPALDARVLGVDTAKEIGASELSPTRARGRYVVVAYRVSNTSPRPIRFLEPQLRLGGRTLREDAGAGVVLPRSRSFPVPPGETLETRAAFDVDPALADRAAQEGALVYLPPRTAATRIPT